MGRAKREYKKIQNYQSLMVTFSKRRNGVIKKAYELGVLCDVDVALLVISPSGKVTPFSINSRMEDIIAKYINLPNDKGGIQIENPGQLLGTLERIKLADDQTVVQQQMACSNEHSSGFNSNDNTKIEDLQSLITGLENKREALLQYIRNFYGDHDAPDTRKSFEWRQNMILTALTRVKARQNKLIQGFFTAPLQHGYCSTAPLQHGYCSTAPLQHGYCATAPPRQEDGQQEYCSNAAPQLECVTAPLQQQCYTSNAPFQQKYGTTGPLQMEYGTTAPPQQECTIAPLHQDHYTSISPSQLEYGTTAPPQQECTTTSLQQDYYTSFSPSQLEYGTTAPLQLEYGTTAPPQQECSIAPLQQDHYTSISPSQMEYDPTAPPQQECITVSLQPDYYTSFSPSRLEYGTTAPLQLEYGTTAPPQQECTTAPLQQEYYTSITPSQHDSIVAPLRQDCTTSSNVNQQGILLQPHYKAENTDFNQEDLCQANLTLPNDGNVDTIAAETAPATMDHMLEGLNAEDQTIEQLVEGTESYYFNNIPSYDINNLQSYENCILPYSFSDIEAYNFNNTELSDDFIDIGPLWCHDV